jgi:hypothetical protein
VRQLCKRVRFRSTHAVARLPAPTKIDASDPERSLSMRHNSLDSVSSKDF